MENVLVCSPMPGPPTYDGTLRSQIAYPEPYYSPAFKFDVLSTRLFLLDRNRFITQLQYLPVKYAHIQGIFKALVEGNYPYKLPEEVLTEAMQEKNLSRIDFLGASPGMWSLHPPYRSKEFYDALPQLIEKIETGLMPESQLGDHDVNDSLVDWTSARLKLKQNRWWKRLVNRWKK
jgi:hypothetical protein